MALCAGPLPGFRGHTCEACVWKGGTQFGGPSLTQYVRQQISLFSRLLTAQVPTLYPRKCCQGRWARVTVREPMVMCGCSVCLDKCVVSKACLIILLLLLFFSFFFFRSFCLCCSWGTHAFCVHVCELVRACVSASICLDKSGIPGAPHV